MDMSNLDRLELNDEEEGLNSPYKESLVFLNNEIQPCGSEAECAHVSSGSFLGCTAHVSQDRAGKTAEDETCDVSMLEYNMTNSPTQPDPISSTPLLHNPCLIVPVSPSAQAATASTVATMVSPFMCGPVPDTNWPKSCTCRPTGSAWDSLRSTTRVPRGSENDPVTAAAYLHLLGESLSLIGHSLQETDKLVCVSKSLSVLLDSLLFTLAPLMSLTSQIPELQGCLEHTVDSTLENVSYMMPGL